MLESILISTIAGAVIAGITQYAKRHKISTRLVLAVLTLISAVSYTGFKVFIPADLQQSIMQFGLQSLGTAVFLYEFVMKNFLPAGTKD